MHMVDLVRNVVNENTGTVIKEDTKQFAIINDFTNSLRHRSIGNYNVKACGDKK